MEKGLESGNGDIQDNIFWADSVNCYDYACFGDVVAFDSAFKRNRYNRAVVTFIGINHHMQTTIFGCGILESETAENYEWLLRDFVQCMGGVKPTSVVTDGDLSMSSAIRSVLLGATHRLCSFHLKKMPHVM